MMLSSIRIALPVAFVMTSLAWGQQHCPLQQAAAAAKQCPSQMTTVATHARPDDIVDTAVAAGDFKTLVAAAKAAGLVDVLKSEGPLTVFAPTDKAFAKLPKGTVETLLKPENKDKLAAILKYHVVPGKVMAADVVKVDSAKTAQGGAISVMVKNGKVFLNDVFFHQKLCSVLLAADGIGTDGNLFDHQSVNRTPLHT